MSPSASASAPPAPAVAPPCPAAREPDKLMAWSAGFSLMVRAIGALGLLNPVSSQPPTPVPPRPAEPAPGQPVMLEIPADSTDAADSAPADAADSPPEPAPATDPIPADPEVLEVPEPPPLEEAAALVEPRPAPTPPPKPKPPTQSTKPKPPRQPAASTPGTRPTSPSGTPSSSGTAQGGTPGGSGRKPAASGVPGGKGRMPQPPYPSFARSRGLQGTVVVSISAAPDGTVTSASVARSSGSPELDRYAVSWIRSRWRMPAGTSSGQQTIHFRLR